MTDTREDRLLDAKKLAKERAKAWRKEAYAKAKERHKAQKEAFKASPEAQERKALMREKSRAEYQKAKAEADAVKRAEKLRQKRQDDEVAKTLQAEREAELRRLLITGDKVGPPKLRVIQGGK